MAKKTLYTTTQLFNTINRKLKEDGLLPDILEYGLAGREELPVKTISWDTIGIVNFGGNEGIYLDISLEGDIGDDRDKVHLGTYKTLDRNKDAFKKMGDLNAEFVFALDAFVKEHWEDFNWTGCDVVFHSEDGKTMKYWSPGEENVKRLCENTFRLYPKYKTAVVTDNATGKTRTVTVRMEGIKI